MFANTSELQDTLGRLGANVGATSRESSCGVHWDNAPVSVTYRGADHPVGELVIYPVEGKVIFNSDYRIRHPKALTTYREILLAAGIPNWDIAANGTYYTLVNGGTENV